ncbi:hypothetical protein LCGC14_1145190 [marine sediment metagenome]|uniref:Uncharacterized protein n=1 Tax=marine sediment metagenome TaxID=412755 RepID=A0A0F9M1W8_9ZZZZ
MSKSDAGKGSRYRPVDRKKWDAWWDEYEANKEKQAEVIPEGTLSDLLNDEKYREKAGLPNDPKSVI